MAVFNFFNDGATAVVNDAKVADLAPLRDMPDVRHVWLAEIKVTDKVLRFVTTLPQVAGLSIANARLTARQFAILDALLPGVAVKVYDLDHDSPAWNAFRRRRANRAARLPASRREEAANRYAQGICLICDRPYDGGRTVSITHGDAADDDIRILRWLPQMETLCFGRCWGVTTSALRHLAGHPTLRTIDLNGPKFTSPLTPLAKCPALEDLEIFPGEGTDPGDSHTAGLEKMTGLRRLKSWSGAFADPTLARIGKLTRLRYLDIPFGELKGDASLRPLAGLHELEMLKLGTPSPLSSECLQHLSGLTRLKALYARIEAGDGDGLRHLAGLANLEFLTLYGQGVTDAGLRHLHGLTRLKVVQVPGSKVTAKGAKALAAALPAVSVHRDKLIARSPRPVIRFRRRSVGGFASVLIPTHWGLESEHDSSNTTWIEDGYEQYDRDWSCSASGVRAVTIRLWGEDKPDEETAAEYLRACVLTNSDRMPRRFETKVVKVKADGDSATGAFPQQGDSHLIGVLLKGGRVAGVDCVVAPKRYAGMLKLLKFVVASLRVGPPVEEEVEVPAGRLV